jgi:trans-aconitate methyltransferase
MAETRASTTPAEGRADADLLDTLDLTKPVAVMLVAVLHFLPDTARAYQIVATLMDRMAPGSVLAISHATYDLLDPAVADGIQKSYGIGTFKARTLQEVTGFADGLELIEPKVKIVTRWRPGDRTDLPAPADADVSVYGFLARKPKAAQR